MRHLGAVPSRGPPQRAPRRSPLAMPMGPQGGRAPHVASSERSALLPSVQLTMAPSTPCPQAPSPPACGTNSAASVPLGSANGESVRDVFKAATPPLAHLPLRPWHSRHLPGHWCWRHLRPRRMPDTPVVEAMAQLGVILCPSAVIEHVGKIRVLKLGIF